MAAPPSEPPAKPPAKPPAEPPAKPPAEPPTLPVLPPEEMSPEQTQQWEKQMLERKQSVMIKTPPQEERHIPAAGGRRASTARRASLSGRRRSSVGGGGRRASLGGRRRSSVAALRRRSSVAGGRRRSSVAGGRRRSSVAIRRASVGGPRRHSTVVMMDEDEDLLEEDPYSSFYVILSVVLALGNMALAAALIYYLMFSASGPMIQLLGQFLSAATRSKTTVLAELRSRRQSDIANLEGALFPGPQGALDAFTDSAKSFLSANNFVGLGVNVYNPDSGSAGVAKNLLTLLKALKTALDASRLQLMATVYFVHGLNKGLDFAAIAKHVDVLVLGTHYLVPDEKLTTLPSPLYGRKPTDLSWESVIDTVLAATKSLDRVVASISFSGSEFVVLKETADADLAKQGLPATGHSQGGPHTRIKGLLAYFEICLMFRSNPWKHAVNMDGVCPVVCKDTYWVGYDNAWSIRQKIVYALQRRLAGIAIQHMAMDDWNGVCGTKMTLMKTVSREMQFCRVR